MKENSKRRKKVEALVTNLHGLNITDDDLPDVFNKPALPASLPAIPRGNLRRPEDIFAFLTVGNAYFTVQSAKTGTRYTFRMNRAACSRCQKLDCHCWKFPTFFVALLTGPENTEDYQYLGMLRENKFRLTKASRLQDSSLPVRAFRFVWERVSQTPSLMPPDCEVWHEGRCGRCGRTLTVPESIERGIGPDCAGKMGL